MENTYCLSAPEQSNCPSSPYKDRKVLVPTCKGRDHAAIVKEGGRELWKRRIDRIMWIRKKKKKERRNKTCWTEETPLCPKRMSHYQEGGQTQTAFPPSHHPLRLWRWSGSSQTRLKIDSRGRRIFRVQTLFLCDLPDLHFFFLSFFDACFSCKSLFLASLLPGCCGDCHKQRRKEEMGWNCNRKIETTNKPDVDRQNEKN